ncbi:acyltransferase family protein [Neotabrizicola sp. sgz301269]|uniref:acyltransferase family protein n=1 Tax=Neotabrizicola sp. sgz301269 TaxID=3276282 RepID=UPI0037701F9A
MQASDGTTRYRPDIDGLRAIAVLSVIFYHLSLPGAGSGYAGVDVFFVISGFLIGGIVLRERAEGTFTYRRFYARRIRRILPALFAVILCILPFAWAQMTPHDLRYFGGAVAATLAFLSNVWFYSRIDYFNPEAALDPLLHTWSLGVEEQFYLLFPPLVALAARFGRRALLPLLALLGLASLAVALKTSEAQPTLAFYLLHTRFWELMAGVLAAAFLPHARKITSTASAVLALLGLGLVLIGVSLLPVPLGWPGPTTLVPVAGAVLLVLFGAVGPAGRLLSSRPFRAVGLISYSAYLIHHPIISLLVISGRPVQSLTAKLAVVVATLLLAGLCWALVEQPFRRPGPLSISRRRVLDAAFVALLAFAIGGHVTKGYPQRLPPQARAVLAYGESRSPTHDKCVRGRAEVEGMNPGEACLHNPNAKGPQIVIWGDSHVAAAAYQIAQALPQYPLREFSTGGCPAIPGMKNIDQLTQAPVAAAAGCAAFDQIVKDWIIAQKEVKLVILYAYWANYVEREPFDTRAGYVLPDVQYAVPVENDGSIPETQRQTYLQRQFAGLVRDLEAAGKEVLIVYPLPIGAWHVPQYVARQMWKEGRSVDRLTYPAAAFRDQTANSRAVLDAAPSGPMTHRLDVSDRLCGPEVCTLYADGVAYFFDTNHLSQAGVALIAPEIAAAVRAILAPVAP